MKDVRTELLKSRPRSKYANREIKIYEQISEGNFYDVNKTKIKTENVIAAMTTLNGDLEIARGLLHLNKRHIVRRNLSAGNILEHKSTNSEVTLKISDFDCSKYDKLGNKIKFTI